MISYLVGGRPTPLKNMKVSWDDEIPNIWEKKGSKPPARFYSRSDISILTGGSSYLLLLVEWEPTVHKPVRNGHQFFQICCMRAKPMCPLLISGDPGAKAGDSTFLSVHGFVPQIHLVGGIPTILKHMSSSMGRMTSHIYEMENNPNV